MAEKPEQGPSDEAREQWHPASQYAARIGGIIYRNVQHPILVNGDPALTLHRNAKTGELAVSLELNTQDGMSIAKIEHNKVVDLAKGYFGLHGPWGQSIIDTNGRVWYDLRALPDGRGYEIDCSCLLFGPGGYPLFLHPDRTCLGSPHGNNPPDISRLTMRGQLGADQTAINFDGGGRFYVIGLAFENMTIGIAVTYSMESHAS